MAETAVPITAGSGTNIDGFALPDGKIQQAVAIGDGTTQGRVAHVGAGGDMYSTLTSPNAAALGIFANLNPYGTLRVTGEPSTLFMDAFDGSSIDTNRWTAGGNAAGTVANGGATIAPTVGASVANSTVLTSVPTFTSPGVGFLTFSEVVTLEATQTNAVNVHRFWGKGQVTSYAYATPVTDGIGFEVEGTTGALQCVVYVGGTKYVINSSTVANITSTFNGAVSGGVPAGTALPANAAGTAYGAPLIWQGGAHRYAVMVRSDIIYWFIEGTEKPVAALAYVSPNVQALPVRLAAITNPAATSLANTFVLGAVAVNDHTGGNAQISDGTYPHRKAKVDATGNLAALANDVTGSGTITTQNLVSGGVATAGSAVALALNGASAVTVQVTGTYTGVLTAQGTVDGVNWITLNSGVVFTNMGSAAQSSTIFSGGVGIWQVATGGLAQIRITGLAAMTGTATVTMRATAATTQVALFAPLPTGGNSLGGVVATPASPTLFTLNSAATTNATSVKASSTRLYEIAVSNQGAAAKFVKIYNKATAPTVGTDTPVLTIAIPIQSTTQTNVVVVNFGSLGMLLGTGFALAITGAVTDADTTAVAVSDVHVMASYL